MKIQTGFIFIFTLCITAIMSVLLLATMQNVLLYQRASNQQEEVHFRFYKLEHSAHKLINVPLKKIPRCILKQDLANKVIGQAKKSSCRIVMDKMVYHYLIEDLGEYPCLVSGPQGNLKSTHHFRYTLLLPSDNPVMILQIRVIRPAKFFNCIKQAKYVALGISSWRYINTKGNRKM